MSKFNKKGYRTLLAKKDSGEIVPVPVKVGSKVSSMQKRRVAKLKKERQQAFRQYKDNIRELKKRVPLEERSKMNWSKTPERYL